MSKVGRNDPCPCGSGKKYKKCCEKNENVPFFQKKNIKPLQAKNMSSFFQNTLASSSSSVISTEKEELKEQTSIEKQSEVSEIENTLEKEEERSQKSEAKAAEKKSSSKGKEKKADKKD